MLKRRRSSTSSSDSNDSAAVTINTSFVDQTPSSPLNLSHGTLDINDLTQNLCDDESQLTQGSSTGTGPGAISFKGLLPAQESFDVPSLKSFELEIEDDLDTENIELPESQANLEVPIENEKCSDTSSVEDEQESDLEFDDDLSFDSEDDEVLCAEENSKPLKPDNPVYNGAPITISESLLAVLSYAVRHNLDGKAIVDLLKLIDLHLKEEDKEFKATLYYFKQHFSHLKAPVKFHFFCSSCLSPLPSSTSECPNIKTHQNTKTQCSYFLEISLEDQLQRLYKRKGILESILSRFSREKLHPQNIEDIYDGQLYKEFVESGFLSEKNKFNISLTWNSDGVPVFKSMKTSMWPIFFVINELPFKMRFKTSNVLLGGIWYGTKPSANMMLQPFVDSLTKLCRGIEVKPYDDPAESIIVQGILLAGTADLPAKADFMGLKYPSGSHSCAVCKISGKSVKVKETESTSPRASADEDSLSGGEGEKGKNKKMTKPRQEKTKERIGSVWVFPYEEQAALRQHDETEAFGVQVLKIRSETKNDKAHKFGVKHPTYLSKIMPDMIRGMGIDDLHHSYHGVGHKLLELWTSPKFHKMPWSIKGKLPLLDNRLQSIKLPNYVQCGVRSLSNLSLWKAQHMKVFILYLSLAVLEGVLPTVYYDHFSIFVHCIFILNSTSISPAQLLFCSEKLKYFVKQFQELYGVRHMTINVHNTQHLTFVVNNLGPLRCYSCFPFESLNGQMLKMIHGTKYVQIQLANCAYMLMSLPHEISCIKSQKLSNFTSYIHHSYQRVKLLEQISSDTFAAGKYIVLPKVTVEVRAAMAVEKINSNVCKYFSKLKKGAILFVAKSYSRSTKTASHLISYKNSNNDICYGIILVFIKVSCSASCVEICTCQPSYLAAIQNIVTRKFSDFRNVKSIQHVLRYTYQDVISFVNVSQLSHICFSVDIAGKDPILCERVNWLEME
ncbi:Protein KINKY POLLEN [Frankliniella fusca]|uniref:Protein KINKY POLLEN n=1 Tax=Frankliniella fusca TaxID=407009 RepID=A0AAE1HJN5_9NEOP|nr:Protein KINKY POLLEN [Frankliniella fusca]